MKITCIHINELNEYFEKHGAICRILPCTIFQSYSYIVGWEFVPSSIFYILHDTKLTLNELGKKFVADYFAERNINIAWNNTGAIFYEIN